MVDQARTCDEAFGTGDLSRINKYLHWGKGTIIFVLVRLLPLVLEATHAYLSVSIVVFNALFTQAPLSVCAVCSIDYTKRSMNDKQTKA